MKRAWLDVSGRVGVVALGAVMLGLGGCSHDYWVRFQFLTDAPGDAVADRDRIEIPVGYAMAVRALPMRDDEELGADMEIDLQSRRAGTLGLDHGLREREFVIFGADVGTTWVDVYFGDDYVTEIEARVVPAGD